MGWQWYSVRNRADRCSTGLFHPLWDTPHRTATHHSQEIQTDLTIKVVKRNPSYWCVVCWAVKLLGGPTVAMLTSVLPILIAWNGILAAVTLRQMIFATAEKAEGIIEATTVRGELV